MRLTMKIGVLAVQGAFIEHEHMIEEIGHTAIEIRQRDDLEGLDGLILPGGESTVQGQLLNKLDMMKDIKNMISNGLPTLATCAGLILLSEHIADDDIVHIGTLPVTIKRNAYGRQLSSFVTNADIKHIGNILNLSRNLINVLFRCYTLIFSDFLYLLTVFVSTCKEKYILTYKSVKTCYCVRKNYLICITYMRFL